jgi:hypothetical protein
VSHRPTLNKILADRRAALAGPQAEETVRERVRKAVREVFRMGPSLDRRYFPETSADIPDAPALTLVVLAPEDGWEPEQREATRQRVEAMIRDCGERGRTFKSGLIFVVPEDGATLADEVRTLLALETLEDPAEQDRLRLEPAQVREIQEKRQQSEQELKERVWRTYRHILLLGEEGLQEVDLGPLHSSAAGSLVGLILARLRQEGQLEERVSPDFLVRNWPPALAEEWSTKAVRDAFFASPVFPRLLDPETLRATIAEGVRAGKFGYVGKAYGEYQGLPRLEDPSFGPEEVEFSEQVVLLPREKALALLGAPPSSEEEAAGPPDAGGAAARPAALTVETPPAAPPVSLGPVRFSTLRWAGEVPPQKWTQFYMRILSRFATDPTLRLRVDFTVAPEAGISEAARSEVEAALRELGLDPEGLTPGPLSGNG